MTGTELAESIRQVVHDAFAADRFSGVVAVHASDAPLIEQACGLAHRGWGIENRTTTRFRLASISKMFTAVAVLQLVERTGLALSTPITDVLDLHESSIGPDVEIRHLLTMTSGIADWFEESENWEAEWEALCREHPLYLLRTNRDYLPLFATKPAHFGAGERYRYNNAGYILLGLVIEAITGRDYFDAVRHDVFAAAAMANADFVALDAIAPDVAEGYVGRGEGGFVKNVYSTTPAAVADGGAVATAADLFAFVRALRSGRLLSAEHTEMALRPVVAQKETPMRGYYWHYGHGIEFVAEEGGRIVRWGHTGEEDGVSCRLYHYPDAGLDVVILGNQSWCAGDLGWAIHELIERPST